MSLCHVPHSVIIIFLEAEKVGETRQTFLSFSVSFFLSIFLRKAAKTRMIFLGAKRSSLSSFDQVESTLQRSFFLSLSHFYRFLFLSFSFSFAADICYVTLFKK